MSAACSLRAGEPFSPYGIFRGIFIPDAVLTHPGLNDAAVLLWGRLARYCGKADFCFPSLETLARDSRASVDSVSRSLKRLEAAGLIRRERRGRGPAVCSMLWQPELSSSLRGESGPNENSAEVRSRPAPTPQFCGSNTAKVRSRYKEEKNQEEKNLDSSSVEVRPPRATTTKSAWWTDEDLPWMVQLMRAAHPDRSRSGALPAPPVRVAEYARLFDDAEDFRLYFGSVAGWQPAMFRSGGYGWYLTDAATWPERRRALMADGPASGAVRRAEVTWSCQVCCDEGVDAVSGDYCGCAEGRRRRDVAIMRGDRGAMPPQSPTVAAVATVAKGDRWDHAYADRPHGARLECVGDPLPSNDLSRLRACVKIYLPANSSCTHGEVERR